MPVTGTAINYVEIWIETGNEHTTVRLVIEPLKDIWDNIWKSGAAHECAPVSQMKHSSGWVRFPIDFLPSSPLVRLVIDSDNPISLGFNRRLLPGYFRQKLERGVWHSRFGSEQGVHIPVRIYPPQSLFGPGQTVNGWSRPVNAPNLWMSDPDQPLPQWIELSWEAPISIRRGILLFDTNLHLEHRLRNGFYRSPECVKHYTIEAKVDGGWAEVSRTRGNYHRRNECSFAAVLTESLRVVIEASNGDPSARIYEIKVY
ncbi:MAG: hypothetical protein HN368_00955 [Spirochaetales bacterium]|nr:hypothetical protein [Spirochaetales bacterium]